jgi:hypothetical protein
MTGTPGARARSSRIVSMPSAPACEVDQDAIEVGMRVEHRERARGVAASTKRTSPERPQRGRERGAH